MITNKNKNKEAQENTRFFGYRISTQEIWRKKTGQRDIRDHRAFREQDLGAVQKRRQTGPWQAGSGAPRAGRNSRKTKLTR